MESPYFLYFHHNPFLSLCTFNVLYIKILFPILILFNTVVVAPENVDGAAGEGPMCTKGWLKLDEGSSET